MCRYLELGSPIVLRKDVRSFCSHHQTPPRLATVFSSHSHSLAAVEHLLKSFSRSCQIYKYSVRNAGSNFSHKVDEQTTIMPKTLHTLDDHVQDTIEARRRTQSGRFQPVATGTERVADVISSSCASVADAFTNIGFRWSKSGLRFSRKIGPFTHIVSFQADSANSSGSNVVVSLYAQVKSGELSKWRESAGVADGDNVWITQLGYLSIAHEYFKWQLVDPDTRQSEIESMIKAIRELALPAFEACSSKNSLSANILERREITSGRDWSVDTALWVENNTAATTLVLADLSASPRNASNFHEYYRQEIRNPSLIKPLNRTHRLACTCVKHKLQIPSTA